MAAVEEVPEFDFMTEEELRLWVDANPTRVNDRDRDGCTPLHAAACTLDSLPLFLWLLRKGSDVNAKDNFGYASLHSTDSPDIITALLDNGADPLLLSDFSSTPLMFKAFMGKIGCVARLVQHRRVRASVDFQDENGDTALHIACNLVEESDDEKTAIVRHLLRAGADPFLTNIHGLTPLALLQNKWPENVTAITVLEQAPDAEKAAILIKARRFVVAAAACTEVPPYVKRRVAPVTQTAVTDGSNEDNCKLSSMVAYLLGVGGGPKNEGRPRDVFRVVMDLLMPTWDPLRRGIVGEGGTVRLD